MRRPGIRFTWATQFSILYKYILLFSNHEVIGWICCFYFYIGHFSSGGHTKIGYPKNFGYPKQKRKAQRFPFMLPVTTDATLYCFASKFFFRFLYPSILQIIAMDSSYFNLTVRPRFYKCITTIIF